MKILDSRRLQVSNRPTFGSGTAVGIRCVYLGVSGWVGVSEQ